MAQFTGQVRWFNLAKGYGFLGRKPDTEVLFHYSCIELDGSKVPTETDGPHLDLTQGAKEQRTSELRRTRAAKVGKP